MVRKNALKVWHILYTLKAGYTVGRASIWYTADFAAFHTYNAYRSLFFFHKYSSTMSHRI